MKKSDSAGHQATSIARRNVLKAAAAGAGLSLLPAAQALAAMSLSKAAPALVMGYCAHEAIEQLGTAAPIGDAFNVRPSRATYELRVLGVATQAPLALSAQYGALAQHCFWQAWREQGLLQRSPPSTIRWAANAGDALQMNVKLDSGVQTTQVTAQAGIYVLVIVPAGHLVPSWSSLALSKQYTGGASMKLVARADGAEAAFPYAVFAVQAAQG